MAGNRQNKSEYPFNSQPATEAKQDNIINALLTGVTLSTDNPTGDAFGRLRVSNPSTVFDSKNIHDDSDLASTVENQPLFYDNQQISGSGTATTYNTNQASTTLSVTADTAGRRVRQTRQRFNYQPGKSQLGFLTFVMSSTNEAGVIRREGLFDDKNGLFFEDNGTNYGFVRRTYTTGTAVDNRVAQANWNLDKMDGTGASGITLDFTKTQIMVIDYEWLGVGRVRMGWNVDGVTYWSHQFLNTNNLEVVYMSDPNLPIRTEIINDGNGGAAGITQICSTVISEGGQQETGMIRSGGTDGTHVDCATENTWYAIVGIRLKSNYLSETIEILNVSLQEQAGSKKLLWGLFFNPTVEGTFTYADVSLSGIQLATGATANTVTGGYKVAGGFFESGGQQQGNAGSSTQGVVTALKLGSLIDGTPDTFVLCAKPVGGTINADVEGNITWRELS